MDQQQVIEEKPKKGKGVSSRSKSKAPADLQQENENDLGDSFSRPKDDFLFTINGVELTRETLESNNLHVNTVIPLFNGAVLELTSVEIELEPRAGEEEANVAKAHGGRMLMSPTNTHMVMEAPISEVLLRDENTNTTDKTMVQGALRNSFAFPFPDGTFFYAQEGEFDEDHLISVQGGTMVFGKDEVAADVLMTEDGLFFGRGKDLEAGFNEQRAAEMAAAALLNQPEPTQEPKQEPSQKPTENTKDETQENDSEENEPQPVIQGEEIEKTFFEKTSEDEEDDKKDDGEEKKEDIVPKTRFEQLYEDAKNSATDAIKEKAKAVAEDMKDEAVGLVKKAANEALSKVSIEQFISNPTEAFDTFKNTLWDTFKQDTIEAAKARYGEAKETIESLDDIVAGAIADSIREKADEASKKLKLAKDVLANVTAFIHIAQYFGFDTKPIEKAITSFVAAVTGFEDNALDKMNQILPKNEDESEEEKQDDNEEESNGKKLSVKVDIIEGALSLRLFMIPAYRIKMGGNMKLHPASEGQPISVDLGVSAYGFASVTIGLDTIVGNDLFALIGTLSATAKLLGTLEKSTEKFASAQIKSLEMGSIKNGEMTLHPPKLESVNLSMGAELEGKLAADLRAKSELFSWEKQLGHKEFVTTLAGITYTARASKEGNLFTFRGWHVDDQCLTTAFLDENKSDLMKLSVREHPIESTAELVEKADTDLGNLGVLDKKLDKVQKNLSKSSSDKTIGAAFSKKEGNLADETAETLETMKKNYTAVFLKLGLDIAAMENAVREFTESPEYQRIAVAVSSGVSKHMGRADMMDSWAAINPDSAQTREDVLEHYRGIAAGTLKRTFNAKTGYERDDWDRSYKEAEAELYTRDTILEYEQGRAEVYADKRYDRYEKLQEIYGLYGKDPSKKKDFFKEYKKLLKDDPDGSLLDHIAEYGLSAGIFKDEKEAVRMMQSYEQQRHDHATKDIGKEIIKLQDACTKLKTGVKTYDKGFTELFAKDEEMWNAFIHANTDNQDRENYFFDIAQKGDKKKNKGRLSLMLNLRAQEKDYNNAKDSAEKEQILAKSKAKFEEELRDTTFKGRKKEWDDFMDVKSQFKRLTAEDILVKSAEDYINDKTFYKWDKSKEQDPLGRFLYRSFRAFGSNNKARKEKALADDRIQRIYEEYLSTATDLDTIDRHLALWDVDDILDYETDQATTALPKISKDPEKYYDHFEKVHFLKIQKDIVKIGGVSEEYFDVNQTLAETVDHYFKGTRPNYLAPLLNEEGNPYDVSPGEDYPKYYLDKIKGIRDVNDKKFCKRMQEALSHKLDLVREQRKAKVDEVLNGLSEEDKRDPRKVKEVWDKKIKEGEDFLNKRIDPSEYGYHEMLGYLQFKIERTAGHYDEAEFIKAAKNGLPGKQEVFSPENMLLFAMKYRDEADKKHGDRLKMIKEAIDSGKSYDEIVEAYNTQERNDSSGKVEWAKKQIRNFFNMDHESGLDSYYEKNENLLERITPDKIMIFELRRINEGSNKHHKRIQAVEEAGDKAKEVYKSEKLGGGAGFYSAIRQDIKDRASMAQEMRSAADELKRIREYEVKKAEKFKQMQQDAEKDIRELREKQGEVRKKMDESNARLVRVSNTAEILRKRPDKLEQYKALKETATEIAEARKDVSKVEEEQQKVEDLRKRMDEANDNRNKMLADVFAMSGD